MEVENFLGMVASNRNGETGSKPRILWRECFEIE